jgi:hypothetical protein
MSKKHLVLALPKSISKIKKKFSEHNSSLWLYLGRNFLTRRKMAKKLGSKFSHIDISKLHNEVANCIRHEHVQWIDTLNRTYGANIEWWFRAISSRNVYSSNLFQYSCYMEILERLWESGNIVPDLIVIESPGLAKAIQKWASKKNITVEIVHYYKAIQISVIHYFFHFLRLGKFVITSLMRWIAAYISKEKYKSESLKISPSIIVDTFIHDYCLSEDGVFKDRYFPYLHEYLSEKGMQVVVHPVLYGFGLLNYFSIYNRMRRSSTKFIIQEDFLSFSDYFLALTFPLRTLRQEIKAPPFRNFDLSDILKEEQNHQSFSSSMQAVLIYHLFLRLGEAGLRHKQIINWYENQIIDKALIAGARKAFPEVKIIGAQMFIHSPNFLNLFPSQSEVEAQVTPHLLLETSQYQCQIAQAFTKDIPCMPAAALRYSHLFNGEDMMEHRVGEKKQTILVILPFDIPEAVEILEKLKNILNQINDDIVILIKGHPDYNLKDLISVFGEQAWPNRYKVFNSDMQEALSQTSIAISSNSSSMAEAVAKGIPVIFIGRQTVLNQNILSNLNMEIVTECFSTSELIEAINKYLNLSAEKIKEYKGIGKKVRDLLFTPMNEDTMLPFLGINGENHVS